MDIGFEEWRPEPPQVPRGHAKRQPEPPTVTPVPQGAREALSATRDARMYHDLAELCQDQLPPTTVVSSALVHHRLKNRDRHWPFNACVAHPVTQKELYGTPDAFAIRDLEWNTLIDKTVFDWSTVDECSRVAARARKYNRTVHMGLVFGFCVQKNAKLVNSKLIYKYLYGFQGTRVMDQT